MVCARVRAIMHSLALVHHRYVHAHNHGISKMYESDSIHTWINRYHVGLAFILCHWTHGSILGRGGG